MGALSRSESGACFSETSLGRSSHAWPKRKSLSEITEQAIELLTKELGLVATLRFLKQFTTGYGNYTVEREALFKDLTVEDALTAMKGIRNPLSE